MTARTATVVGAVLLVALTAPGSFAAESATGRVIDLACYMLDKRNTAPVHTGRGYACAQACAKEGFQVGLLTDNGQVFEIIGGLAENKNAKLIPHLGAMVTITGELGQHDGFKTISAADLTRLPNNAR